LFRSCRLAEEERVIIRPSIVPGKGMQERRAVEA
jgi:hypothetical protein